MKRRDTLIIAILVNAGLLLVLFATAMNSKEKVLEKQNVELAGSQLQTQNMIASSQEEMDHMLNQYVTTAPTLTDISNMEVPIPISSPSITPVLAAPPIPNPSPQVAQTASQLPAAKGETQIVNITVKKGDYLDKIAKNNGTTVNDIIKLNHLESTQLKIGQVLKVPVKGISSEFTQDAFKSKEAIPSMEPEYYVVKNGDNPWLIASKNQVKLEELLRLNNLDDQKAKKLKPGDKLRIR